MRIILASASPRRCEILQQVGLDFEVMPSQIDETIQETEPAKMVEKLSFAKAESIMEKIIKESNRRAVPDHLLEDFVVIGADTAVAREGIIYGKPESEEHAFRILQEIQGKKHEVFTGVTLMGRKAGKDFSDTFHVGTVVEMLPMSDEQIQAYIQTREPMDKAGGYGIQGRGAAYIRGITGDYYNVVGLPVSAVLTHLSL